MIQANILCNASTVLCFFFFFSDSFFTSKLASYTLQIFTVHHIISHHMTSHCSVRICGSWTFAISARKTICLGNSKWLPFQSSPTMIQRSTPCRHTFFRITPICVDTEKHLKTMLELVERYVISLCHICIQSSHVESDAVF